MSIELETRVKEIKYILGDEITGTIDDLIRGAKEVDIASKSIEDILLDIENYDSVQNTIKYIKDISDICKQGAAKAYIITLVPCNVSQEIFKFALRASVSDYEELKVLFPHIADVLDNFNYEIYRATSVKLLISSRERERVKVEFYKVLNLANEIGLTTVSVLYLTNTTFKAGEGLLGKVKKLFQPVVINILSAMYLERFILTSKSTQVQI